jgi:hypothetical protein
MKKLIIILFLSLISSCKYFLPFDDTDILLIKEANQEERMIRCKWAKENGLSIYDRIEDEHTRQKICPNF